MVMKSVKCSLIALGCLLVASPVLAQSVGEKTGGQCHAGHQPFDA
jgi:hypothetical protein